MYEIIKLYSFIESLVIEGWLDLGTQERAFAILDTLFEKLPNLIPPRIGPGPEVLGFTWQNDKTHINLELFNDDDRIEFFSEDLVGGAVIGYTLWNTELDSNILNNLKEFCKED